jgi:polar amino acid transport system substrate-binding protein
LKLPKRTFWEKMAFAGIILTICGLTACAIPADTTGSALQAASLPDAQPTATGAIRYAIFPAPPYMIGAGSSTDAISGIDVDVAQEIAQQLNLKISFVRCTWERCLELMKSGEVDLLSSAYKKTDREQFMLYLDRPYLGSLPIAFYSLKSGNYKVKNYEDIYQFGRVGVLQGASYFERFDQDTQVKKIEVPSQEQLFPMLLAGHLDVIAGYVPTENYHIYVNGYGSQIVRSEFINQEPVSVYMTVSKKSFLAGQITRINQINDQLLDQGIITRVVNSYYEKYH